MSNNKISTDKLNDNEEFTNLMSSSAIPSVQQSYESLVDENMKLKKENHRYVIFVSKLQSEINELKFQCQEKDSMIDSLYAQLSRWDIKQQITLIMKAQDGTKVMFCNECNFFIMKI